VNYVVVTGVSTGIGFAVAKDLIESGYHVFGSVRKPEDAQNVERELGSACTPLLFDVTDPQAVSAAVEQVTATVGSHGLRGLVNNAGICRVGPLLHVSQEELRDHFEVNVFGLMDATRKFLPLLGATRTQSSPPGRIVNISSLSGRIAYPMLGAYAASKFAVEALSDSLRRELQLYGIDVIVIEPGAIRTPIWDKGLQIDFAAYKGTDYTGALRLLHKDLEGQRDDARPVSAVTTVIRKALIQKRPKTRYVVPNSRVSRWWIPRLLPDRWLDFVVGHTLKLRLPKHQSSTTPAENPTSTT
jgi:NAD(P)-dependent dehydrogenase (short-subunit alcohol dehydrogenase family)